MYVLYRTFEKFSTKNFPKTHYSVLLSRVSVKCLGPGTSLR